MTGKRNKRGELHPQVAFINDLVKTAAELQCIAERDQVKYGFESSRFMRGMAAGTMLAAASAARRLASEDRLSRLKRA